MAKVKAKWLYLDVNTTQNESGNLAVKLDPAGNLGESTSGVKIEIAENVVFGNENAVDLDDGVDPSDAITVSQLNAVAATLQVWKEVLLDPAQLVGEDTVISPAPPSPFDHGFLAAQVLIIEPGKHLVAGDQLIFTDGSSPDEVYEADVNFSLTTTVMEEIADVINANSSIVTAIATNALASISGEYQALIVIEKIIGSGIRVWQNTAGSPVVDQKFMFADPTMTNLYEATDTDLVYVPDADPGSPSNFGIYRSHDQLANDETHLTRTTDAAYVWDHDAEIWVLWGETSIPDATKALKGKVQISDGIAVSSGVISVDILQSQGVKLVGTTPDKQLALDYDDSTIGILGTPGQLGVKLGGITNAKLNDDSLYFLDESGSPAGSVALGGTITFAAGEGINTSVTAANVTISFEDATSGNKGVFTMNSADFTGAAGTPLLDDNVLGGDSGVVTTDSGNATPLAHTITFDGNATQGVSTAPILVGSPTNDFEIQAADATTGSKGVFQLDSGDFTVSLGVVSVAGTVANQFDTNDGSPASAVPASGILQILSGVGITTSAPASPGDTIVITGDNATYVDKGFASYHAGCFDVALANVSLKDPVIKSVATDGSPATPMNHEFSLVGDGAQGVSTEYGGVGSPASINITIADATDISKGVFQLDPTDFTVPLGVVTLTGITLKTINAPGAATASLNSININGGYGINTSAVGNTVTVAYELATEGLFGSPEPQRGAFSLSSASFAVDVNNHVTLIGTGSVQSVVADGPTVATPVSNEISIIGGEGIDTAGSGDNLTISGEDASTSNKGVFRVSSTSFSDSSGVISIATDGVKDSHVDWGSGLNQVDATDWLLDSTSSPGFTGVTSPAPTNTQDALEDLEVQIDNVHERQVDQFTLSSGDITNKYVMISSAPSLPSEVVVIVKNGVHQHYGDDFVITASPGDRLSWDGLGMDGLLSAGDKLSVVYTI